jgi:hypothetical protein
VYCRPPGHLAYFKGDNRGKTQTADPKGIIDLSILQVCLYLVDAEIRTEESLRRRASATMRRTTPSSFFNCGFERYARVAACKDASR